MHVLRGMYTGQAGRQGEKAVGRGPGSTRLEEEASGEPEGAPVGPHMEARLTGWTEVNG